MPSTSRSRKVLKHFYIPWQSDFLQTLVPTLFWNWKSVKYFAIFLQDIYLYFVIYMTEDQTVSQTFGLQCKLLSYILFLLLWLKTKQIKLDRILITFNSRFASPPGDLTCQHNKIVDYQVTTVQCWNWNCYKNNSTTGKINCPHNLSLYLIRTCYKLFICLINFSFCPRISEVIPTPPVALLLPALLVDIEYQLQRIHPSEVLLSTVSTHTHTAASQWN